MSPARFEQPVASGVVRASLPAASFLVRLDAGPEVVAFLSATLRRRNPSHPRRSPPRRIPEVAVGDRVRLERSPQESARWRIVAVERAADS